MNWPCFQAFYVSPLCYVYTEQQSSCTCGTVNPVKSVLNFVSKVFKVPLYKKRMWNIAVCHVTIPKCSPCLLLWLQGLLVLCLCRGKLDVSPTNIPDDLPDSLRDFLHKCLNPNELLRLPAHELLCHPFITPSPSPLHPRPLPPSALTSLAAPTNKPGTDSHLYALHRCPFV